MDNRMDVDLEMNNNNFNNNMMSLGENLTTKRKRASFEANNHSYSTYYTPSYYDTERESDRMFIHPNSININSSSQYNQNNRQNNDPNNGQYGQYNNHQYNNQYKDSMIDDRMKRLRLPPITELTDNLKIDDFPYCSNKRKESSIINNNDINNFNINNVKSNVNGKVNGGDIIYSNYFSSDQSILQPQFQYQNQQQPHNVNVNLNVNLNVGGVVTVNSLKIITVMI
ncbi:7639_t:CDS:2 [Diversispora eburnea]|uniref:7639_t:CDS:1 n=1 Tax=Diversispora eburnea TaxID=1213867 RepID=A0A9N9BPV1_9GLOM|nr:7639_t:CDS:2 [Diversispora eburnea]